MSKPENSVLNPRTTYCEFLGSLSTLFICMGVPVTTYALYFVCSEQYSGCPPTQDSLHISLALSDPAWWKGLWDTQATLMYSVWYAFCVVAWVMLPGDHAAGTTLRTGEKKQYKLNAFSTFLFALSLTSVAIFLHGPQSFTFFYEKFVGFITASMIVSVLQAVACYVASFRRGALLALGGNGSNPIYNFYIGRELNPSIGSFDLKSFNHLRPGLILWILIDIGMVCEQATRLGGLRQVTTPMWLVLLFQGLYVADILYHERGIFTQIDITTDGFGFMHSVGCLSWLPFSHSLQARYLVFTPVVLGPVWTTIAILFNCVGYYIFRVANAEKNDFRNGKNPKNLQFFTTESGSKLLISGWWGRSRHPNYFGDFLMALAWSFLTGFNTPITYAYFLYLIALLAHRQQRDDEACEKKQARGWHVRN